MTTFVAVGIICAIWLLPVVIFLPWLFVYGEHKFVVNKRYFIACHADWPSPWMLPAFTVGVVFLTCYLLPLLCIGVFYSLIGVKVWRRRVGNLSAQSRAAANIRRSKTRLLRMLVTVFVLFAVSWLPLYIINLCQIFGALPEDDSLEERVLEHYLWPLAQWLGASNSCVNPFVYCYFSQGFRSGVADLLRAVFCRSVAAESESTLLHRGHERRLAAAADMVVTTDVGELRRCRTVIREDNGEDGAEIIALPSLTMQDTL